MSPAQTAWAREFYAAVRPSQTGRYLNFLGHTDDHRLKEAFDGPAHGD